jgi:hypothetical protein
MARVLGAASLAGLILALWVHVLTFFHVDVIEKCPLFWFLHVGAIVAVAGTIPLMRDLGPRPSLSQLRAILPDWAVAAILVAGAYAVLNFALFAYLSELAGPGIVDGKFALQSHGKLARFISEAEYHQQQAYVARGFSGHWIAFFAFGAVIGLARHKASQKKSEDGST